jgi:hypothetical protein
MPLRPACEAMTKAASGLLMLPPLTTLPVASVKVIEPTEFGSGSHPGVTDADADRLTSTRPRTMGTTSTGASIVARVASRTARPPADTRRNARRERARPRWTTRFTSHPHKRSSRQVSNRNESRPAGETGTSENAHARRTPGERTKFPRASGNLDRLPSHRATGDAVLCDARRDAG